jgi:tryptophanyl-tRNA synthetase
MIKILTGIQSTGIPHLGNILGAINPIIELSKNNNFKTFAFIADLHSLTTIKNATDRRNYVNSVAASFITLGYDMKNNYLYRQSKIPQITELNWYLNCFTPYSLLNKSHSFKDKSDNLKDINAGLFTYPVLMTSDILLFDANIVPVGKDQKQHLEITRDIAQKFNKNYYKIFTLPEPLINENVMIIPGTDGRKMSKSYDNFINIFASEKDLQKQINKIITPVKTLEEPKDYKNCIIFKIYSLLANDVQINTIKQNYINGNYGFSHAKRELLELILEKYKEQRYIFNNLINDTNSIEETLLINEEKVKQIAQVKINEVKEVLGF